MTPLWICSVHLRFDMFDKNIFCCQVATFIVQKILLDDMGLDYICTTAERFFAVGRVLGSMVAALAEQPSSRLLKHIIRCYLRLSDNPRQVKYILTLLLPNASTESTPRPRPFFFFFLFFCCPFLIKRLLNRHLCSSPCRACEALRSCLPDMLRDATFSSCLRVS